MPRLALTIVVCLAAFFAARSAHAQGSVQFPRGGMLPSSNFPTAPTISVPPSSYGAVPSFPTGPTAGPSPYGTAIGTTPPGTFGPPLAFDPYSPNGQAAAQFWGGSQPPAFPNSALPPNGAAAPYGSQWAPPVANQPQGQYLFPNGFNDPNGGTANLYESLRLVHDVRFRQTYLAGGDDGNDLGITDSEVSVSFAFPNFLTTGQPLFITPAFAIHCWDGPKDGIHNLPGSAYSAYLDFQYATDPNLQIGAELGFRAGVYTDFETLTSDSLRFQGLALGLVRLTPTMTAKLGVMYIDRNDIKLLPAGGLLWQPNPQLRVDLFFPQPRISQYISTVGTYEVWWYLAGEYGGGAWTVQPISGDPVNRIDINDMRASFGLEWSSPRGLNGFAEIGYVFERELMYVELNQTLDLSDTWMARAGFSF
ncbi:hypothetical protein ETAA8_42770 [Anatilimnocola aggregata]|uniref:Uncharacterized protein n=1 Tax=Anatilimnocola aggregata TaxID=2528021 RepID=A0A517YG17_9BACT|nr:hypothetical protein [Anatilimnocola aggregata]QDU29170.1 hypothetical protein ETAA8_42770 [Anatilimnocola aggregata]